jgi:hypothetical protein
LVTGFSGLFLGLLDLSFKLGFFAFVLIDDSFQSCGFFFPLDCQPGLFSVFFLDKFDLFLNGVFFEFKVVVDSDLF